MHGCDDRGTGQILVGCEDGAVRVWNAETAEAAVPMKHDAPVVAWRFAATGTNASAGGKYARLWDEKGKMMAEMKGSAQLKETWPRRSGHWHSRRREVNFHKGAVAAADKEQKAQTDRLKEGDRCRGGGEEDAG